MLNVVVFIKVNNINRRKTNMAAKNSETRYGSVDVQA